MRRPWTSDRRDRAAAMREQGSSDEQIAVALFGDVKARGSVAWQLLRLGVVRPRARLLVQRPGECRRGDHVVRRFSAEEDAELLRLEAEGLSPYQIGKRLGRRNNSIVGRLATLAMREAITLLVGEFCREELRSGLLPPVPSILGPICRRCGCSQNDACGLGCAWAEPDLCTACAE